MGTHRQGQTVIGAFVEDELKEYIDKLTAERGYLSRSDSLRAIIREHKSIFAKRNGRNRALTPFEASSDDYIYIIMRRRSVRT